MRSTRPSAVPRAVITLLLSSTSFSLTVVVTLTVVVALAGVAVRTAAGDGMPVSIESKDVLVAMSSLKGLFLPP